MRLQVSTKENLSATAFKLVRVVPPPPEAAFFARSRTPAAAPAGTPTAAPTETPAAPAAEETPAAEESR